MIVPTLSAAIQQQIAEHDPESLWPMGMEILAELDDESVPVFAFPSSRRTPTSMIPELTRKAGEAS